MCVFCSTSLPLFILVRFKTSARQKTFQPGKDIRVKQRASESRVFSPGIFSLHLLRMCSLACALWTGRGHRCPKFCLLLFLEVQGHLAKGQRMLAGDGMSQVTKNLLDLTQRRNFYAGDLLSSVEILHNVTETFKRASYEPSSDDVQVRFFFFLRYRSDLL